MAKAAGKGKASRVVVWIILGLLIIGLAGFGVDGFGGGVRGVGQVGDREISSQEYFRTLQREIRAVQQQSGRALPWSEVRDAGLDRAVLRRMVTTAALENEAMRLGISVSDATVRDEVLAVPAFLGLDGSFSRDAYRNALQQEGWSEREFEERIRMELAREILQAGAVSAVPAPATTTDVIFDWFAETRDFDVITIDRGALETPVPTPTEAELRAFHADNAGMFTLPEGRRIRYVWATPAMIADTVDVPEDALRAAFEARADDFRQPERRLVDRLVFPDAESAQAARARIDAGDSDFAAEVAARGMALEDTDMGDVTEAELGAAGAEIFARQEPGLVGPLPSPFGPALYDVVAVLAAQETPFEEAAEQLRDELAVERARTILSDAFDDYEDLLAGGATLEELAEQTALQDGTLVLRPGTRDGIAGYAAFREAAAAVGEGDFPEMFALEDGGVFALRHDGQEPARLEPFEDVEVRVLEAWDSAEARARTAERAEAVAAALRDGATPGDPGLQAVAHDGVRRNDRLSDVPAAAIAAAFALDQPGAHRVVQDDGRALVVTLRAINAPDTATDTAARERAAIAEEVRNSLAQDVFTAWARQLEREAGIRIDQTALDAVHAQFR